LSFSRFCDEIADGQKIVSREAFVLSFTNSTDEFFNIDPDAIFNFLSSFAENYDAVADKWSSTPTRKNELYYYEEKSYRAIYKYFSSEEHKVISSTGGSQTKALTQLIAKIIAYLTDQVYENPSKNTFFEKQYIIDALQKRELLFSSTSKQLETTSKENIREQFRQWLLTNGQSERSAYSHSTTSINTSDKRLNELRANTKSLFFCTSDEVLEALDILTKDPDWSDKDATGKNMYSTGVKKLATFLETIDGARVKIQLFKPFVLLAGISGTGKTRFVREQVKSHGALSDSYQLTPVRPDWHEPGDLLGYQSRLSGKAEYVVTDILRFICKAWRSIANTGVLIESGSVVGLGQVCRAIGQETQLQGIKPFWLCLDEMNLAPVEQYFADYLSILETRVWQWNDSQFQYLCDPLLSASVITDLAQAEQDRFRTTVGLNDPVYDSLWECFSEHGIGIPFNLVVVGTVNMDETTHGFSRKVLDRALTIDFDEFFPNDFTTFFKNKKKPVTFTYPIQSAASIDCLPDIDSDGEKSLTFLGKINTTLTGTPFNVAYRAVNELLLMVISMKPETDLELKAVWDDFLMLKVLSRIEGDIDKLVYAQSDNSLLEELNKILEVEFSQFWNKDAEMEGARPDLFLISSAGEEITSRCRSKAKLQWMQSRLDSSGFTSFWP